MTGSTNQFIHFEPTNTLSKIHPKNYNNSPPISKSWIRACCDTRTGENFWINNKPHLDDRQKVATEHMVEKNDSENYFSQSVIELEKQNIAACISSSTDRDG